MSWLGLVVSCEQKTMEPNMAVEIDLQPFSSDHYQLPYITPQVSEEKKTVTEDWEEKLESKHDFPDIVALQLEQKAALQRGARRREALQQSTQKETKVTQNTLKESQDYQSFDSRYTQDLSTLPVDRSRMLTADLRIGVILEDAIDSQLPGRVIAIADQDVLSANAQYILLPAYTKFICSYQGLEKMGINRLAIQCHRAIRPDGVSIQLTDAHGADMIGQIGLVGKVNNYSLEKYGYPLLVSGLMSIATGLSQGDTKALGSMSNYAMVQLGFLAHKLVNDYSALRPVVKINAGTKIQIIPTTDIKLR